MTIIRANGAVKIVQDDITSEWIHPCAKHQPVFSADNPRSPDKMARLDNQDAEAQRRTSNRQTAERWADELAEVVKAL